MLASIRHLSLRIDKGPYKIYHQCLEQQPRERTSPRECKSRSRKMRRRDLPYRTAKSHRDSNKLLSLWAQVLREMKSNQQRRKEISFLE